MKKLLLFLALSLTLSFTTSAQTFIGNNPDHGPSLPTTCSQASGQTFFLTAVQGGNQPGLYSCINGTFITTGAALPTGSQNVTPTFVSKSTYVSNTNVTSLVVTAPASITDGNCLLAVVAVPNVNTETWTPAAGFTQIGTTLVSNANGKIVVGIFGKTAASESGSYTFAWNTSPGVAQTAQAGMLNISGSACVADSAGVVSAVANAATVTMGTITPANANSIVIVGTFQSPQANGATVVQPLLPINDYLGSTNSPFYFGHFVNGAGVTPSFKASVTSLSDPASAVSNDIVGFQFALAPNITSATTPFVENSINAAQTVNTMNATGTGYIAGSYQSGKFFAVPFSTSCAVNVQNPSNGYNFITSAGTFEMGVCYSSAGNLTLDAGGKAVFVSTFGGSHGGADFLASSGRIDSVSFDASQDLPLIQTPTSSNQLVVGCKTVAPATNPTCAQATQQSDTFINVPSTKLVRIQVGDNDRFTVGDTKNLTSGVAATILSIPLAADQTAGGTVSFSALATDTVNHLNCSTSGTVEYSGENSAGVFVTNTSVIGTNATACTVTLTNVCTFTLTGANPALLQTTCTLVNMASPTSFVINYNVNHLSGTVPTF